MGKKERLRRQREELERAEVEAGSSNSPGFELKVERARTHLRTLGLAVSEWLAVHSDLISEERDPLSGDDVVFVDAPAVAPADAISLIAADCVHNLRASLDQLVYSLAWAGSAGPISKVAAERCEFPIFGPRAPKPAELEKRIGMLAPGAQEVIEALQPHHAGEDFVEEKLWILNQLWNLDKHRSLPLTVFGQQSIQMTPEALSGTATFRVAGPIRERTEVIRFAGGRPDGYPDPKSAIALDIAFGPATAAYGHPVLPFLTDLANYLESDVIGRLVSFLP